MAEYIEREKLKAAINEDSMNFLQSRDSSFASLVMIEIDEIPAADVAPVVHGHWCLEEYEFFNCSVCGGSYYTGAESTEQAKSYLSSGNIYAYCPSCGAKMEETR